MRVPQLHLFGDKVRMRTLYACLGSKLNLIDIYRQLQLLALFLLNKVFSQINTFSYQKFNVKEYNL